MTPRVGGDQRPDLVTVSAQPVTAARDGLHGAQITSVPAVVTADEYEGHQMMAAMNVATTAQTISVIESALKK